MNKPAKDYRKRVRRVLDVMLGQVQVLAGPRYQEPSPEMIEHWIDCFHHIANWGLAGAARLGYPVEYYHGPLTEDQLRSVEQVLLAGSGGRANR